MDGRLILLALMLAGVVIGLNESGDMRRIVERVRKLRKTDMRKLWA